MLETNKNSRNGFFVSFIFHALIAYALLYGTQQKVEIEQVEEKFVTISLSSFEPPKAKEQVLKSVAKPQNSVVKDIKKAQEQTEIKKPIESAKQVEKTEHTLVDDSVSKSETKEDAQPLQNVHNAQIAKVEQKEELNEKDVQDTFVETNFHSIRDKVLANLKYPPIAKRMKQIGVVEVLLVIDTDGKLLEVTLHKSSGYKLLDSSAISAASKLSSQTLPIPQTISRVMLPIYFVLN